MSTMRTLRVLAMPVLLGLLAAGCAGSRHYSHYDMGMYYVGRDKVGDAIQQFQKSLVIDPYDPTVHEALAEAYYSKGYLEQAVAEWEACLKDSSLDPSFYQQEGRPPRKAAWIADAIASRKKAVPMLVKAYLKQGADYTKLGKTDQALDVWNKAVALDDKALDAWVGLGRAYTAAKDWHKAYRAWSRVAALKPDMAEAWKNLGYAAFATSHLSEAQQAFRKYTTMKPDDPVGSNNLAVVLTKMGRYADALGIYDWALQRNPQMVSALNGKGSAYYYQKKYDQARAEWAKVLQIDPENATAKANIRTLVKMGY